MLLLRHTEVQYKYPGLRPASASPVQHHRPRQEAGPAPARNLRGSSHLPRLRTYAAKASASLGRLHGDPRRRPSRHGEGERRGVGTRGGRMRGQWRKKCRYLFSEKS